MPTSRVKQEAAWAGVAGIKISGGPPKQRYFTPSGEVVFAIPSHREYQVKDPATGKVLRKGQRDANLDKGWTLTMPTELKIHCTGCRKYHDTQEEIAECLRLRAINASMWQARVAAEASGPSTDTEGRLDKLEEGLSDIKTLLQQALGAKNG
jgi:hypothetical protein